MVTQTNDSTLRQRFQRQICISTPATPLPPMAKATVIALSKLTPAELDAAHMLSTMAPATATETNRFLAYGSMQPLRTMSMIPTFPLGMPIIPPPMRQNIVGEQLDVNVQNAMLQNFMFMYMSQQLTLQQQRSAALSAATAATRPPTAASSSFIGTSSPSTSQPVAIEGSSSDGFKKPERYTSPPKKREMQNREMMYRRRTVPYKPKAKKPEIAPVQPKAEIDKTSVQNPLSDLQKFLDQQQKSMYEHLNLR